MVKLWEFSEFQHLRLRDSSFLIPPRAYQNAHVKYPGGGEQWQIQDLVEEGQ